MCVCGPNLICLRLGVPCTPEFGFQVAVFFGGMPIKKDEELLRTNCPHIVVGTPGRTLALARSGKLKLDKIKYFVLDECDKMIGDAGTSSKITSLFLDLLRWKCKTDAGSSSMLSFRYASWCAGDCEDDAAGKTSDDVLRYTSEGAAHRLQEVHARCKLRILRSQEFSTALKKVSCGGIWGRDYARYVTSSCVVKPSSMLLISGTLLRFRCLFSLPVERHQWCWSCCYRQVQGNQRCNSGIHEWPQYVTWCLGDINFCQQLTIV